PVNVEMISRFRTAKEQKEILEKVADGKVDILIGTHRLLSKDLKFQDPPLHKAPKSQAPALLVVDEEQRFGVRHKERLKQMRAHIDVLAMSATPIPRTLCRSSASATCPSSRLPPKTVWPSRPSSPNSTRS